MPMFGFSGKIATKMVLGFCFIALLAGITGGLGVIRLKTMDDIGTEMYRKNTVPIGILADIAMNSQKARVNLRGMMLDTDSERMKANAEALRQRYVDVERLLDEFEKSIEGESGRKEVNRIKSLLAEYRPIWEEMVSNQLAGRTEDALYLMRNKGLKIEKEIEQSIRELIDLKVADARRREELNHVTAGKAIVQSVSISVIGMILAVALGLFIAHRITRPIREVVEVAQTIAEGDLNRNLQIDAQDETGQLARAINRMQEHLNSLLAVIKTTSDRVAESVEMLRTTAVEIASRAERAAGQAGSIATASEEMSATSVDIARNCADAAHGAKSASDAAIEGSRVVAGTIDTMGRIAGTVRETAGSVRLLGTRSDEIGSIIATIRDIADQTNLLALNAAIEAARAGEQGRGFAVVADEVRALAARTATATREIESMIEMMQSETRSAVSAMETGVVEVEEGLAAARRSGDALQEILRVVGSVTDQVNQIATATEEQTATTGEISGSIQAMTIEINGTADGASMSLKGVEDLASQTVTLRTLVGTFRLRGDRG